MDFFLLFRSIQVIVTLDKFFSHDQWALCICISSNAYFVCLPDEPGKQVRSAIKIKNTSKSHVAFKVWC